MSDESVPVRRGERTAPAWRMSRPEIWQEPFRELEDLWERMGQMFDPYFWGSRGGGGGAWQPMVDIEETEDSYLYEVELPGLSRDDIAVEVRDHELVISGEVKERERAGTVRRQTRRTGSFAFRSTLPAGVDQEKVKAKLENGLLTVEVRKREKTKPRKIEVK